MEDIKVGEYVRTNKGIAKVTDIFVTNISEITGLGIRTDKPYGNAVILKHSKNMIDLIEIGDYVNGYRIYYITGHYVSVESSEKYDLCFEEQDIKTIVTKEQFERMQYKLEAEVK